MSIGDGIFWSTLLVLAFISILLISKNHKWMLIFKSLLAIMLIATIGAGVYFGYLYYQNMPKPIYELNNVRLGMSKIDVTLEKGEPDNIIDNRDEKNKNLDSGGFPLIYIYRNQHYKNKETVIYFTYNNEVLSVDTICDYKNAKILGISKYTKEKTLYRKLGEPSNTSINKEGTEKTVSFDKYNFAAIISKGEVNYLCVLDGKLGYSEEYTD